MTRAVQHGLTAVYILMNGILGRAGAVPGVSGSRGFRVSGDTREGNRRSRTTGLASEHMPKWAMASSYSPLEELRESIAPVQLVVETPPLFHLHMLISCACT